MGTVLSKRRVDYQKFKSQVIRKHRRYKNIKLPFERPLVQEVTVSRSSILILSVFPEVVTLSTIHYGKDEGGEPRS